MNLNRRFSVLAALALSACGPPTPRVAVFTSDAVSVVTRGSGPDLILVHGLGGHGDEWAGIAGALEGRYRLHLVQIHGFAGFPRARSDSLVLAPAADEIARYIRDSALHRPALIGHSMGGMIAMMVAARHPDVLSRVMVVDMLPSMAPILGAAGATAEGVLSVADQVRARILATQPGSPEDPIAATLPTQTRNQAMLPVLIEHANASDRRTVADAMHELLVTDLRPELSRITMPLTVLYVIPPTAPVSAEQYAAAVPLLYANAAGARLILIEDSNHFIHLDQPARFVREVDAFMGGHAVRDDSAALRAARSYLRGDILAVEAARSARLVFVGMGDAAPISPATRHVVRWTSPSIVTVYGHNGSADAAMYATTMLLDEWAQVCSVSIQRAEDGRAPDITREFLEEAIEVAKGFDPFFAWFANGWVFRDLTWGFETTNRDTLLAFARAAAPDGLVGQRAAEVLPIGRDGIAVEGHVEFVGGRRTPFLVNLRFDAEGRITERRDHYDLTGMTFPLDSTGLGSVLRGMRCR